MRSAIETKEDPTPASMMEIKKLLLNQGAAFEEFKKTCDADIAELKKKGGADPLVGQKLDRISTDLDKLVEQKAAIEAKLAAETKEREELEKRLSRPGAKKGEEGKRDADIIEFNQTLGALAVDRKKSFTPLDAKTYDEYRAAEIKFLRDGKESVTPEEVKTLSVGLDNEGGYFVTPDTSGRVVKKVYETSPMRQISAQQTISTDALEGIEDLDEAGCAYAGERTTSGDTTTPGVGRWKIAVHWIDTEPKATQQLLDDASVDIEGWLADKVSGKFGRFENNEFINGANNKIRGFTAYPTAADSGSGVAWGSLGFVKSGANGAFAGTNPVDKIHDLVGLLKNEYLMNARFVTRRSVITAMRKFKDGQGQYLWQPSLVMGQPETFMGYPIARMEDMPTLATNSFSLAFGDFLQGYQIVDRQGLRTLRDPYTAKPYVKFYTTKRTGGGVLNFEAIKLMQFAA